MKRLIFPLVNALAFVMMFALIGYYVFDIARWALVGFALGFGVGLLVEFGFGVFGGWLYRRRVLLAVLLEILLILAFVAPFIVIYTQTTPMHYPVCCIENSGLGDRVEAVRIPVADGETLTGWYAPPADDSGAVIMVLHGSRADRTGALPHARVLHDAGYGVLVYDQRASGESTGERQSLGWYDQRDITPIIDWLAARPEVDTERIGGVGLSLGASILVLAAPDEPRLRAIWSDGLGINSIDDAPPADGISWFLIWFINRQSFAIAEWYLGAEAVSYTRVLPRIAPRPLQLIASGVDADEAMFNYSYEPYLGENAALWVIEDAPHVGGLLVHPDLYTERMIDFFDTALRE